MDSEQRRILDLAIETAVFMHAKQSDKNGEPYILHPLRVMFAVREHGGSVAQQAAAVLHDVVEDCGVSDEFLEQRFPQEVCDLVDALTKQPGEAYDDFLRRASRTRGALLIKEADIRDNFGRLHLVTEEATRERLKAKYESALAFVQELTRLGPGASHHVSD